MRVQSLGQEDPLEEEIATHSSIPAWKILTRSHDLGAVISPLRQGNFTTDPQPPPRLHLLQWTESSSHHSEYLLTDGSHPAGFQVVCFYLVFCVSPRETRRR